MGFGESPPGLLAAAILGRILSKRIFSAQGRLESMVIGSTERASIRIIGCKAIAATTTKELPQY